MKLLDLLITAIALSMDAFAVSISKGLSVKRLKASHCLITGAYFGGFQALMPLLGFLLASSFASYIQKFDHWIACVLLVLIGANMLAIYRSSALYREIEAGRWREAAEVEKYEEVKELVAQLDIPVEFAMLGASNPVMLHGRLPEQREGLLAALGAVISDIGEERLRRYRVNLRHLWEVREKVPTWVICEKGAEDAS